MNNSQLDSQEDIVAAHISESHLYIYISIEGLN